MSKAQMISLMRFVKYGSTLLEQANNYFIFETSDGRKMLVHITPEGHSSVYNLTLHAHIDPSGEAIS